MPFLSIVNTKNRKNDQNRDYGTLMHPPPLSLYVASASNVDLGNLRFKILFKVHMTAATIYR